MCSIFGYFSKSKDRDILISSAQKALNITRYRGPDHSNFIFFSELNLTLGHNRLSIIDLTSKANQPMSTKDKKLWIVFNGEIYNHLEIKDELIGKGYEFLTKSDTEVILNAYKEYGVDFVKMFDGMFAFCLLDRENSKIILARDISGEKPLFYYYDSENFIFSSELKQILIQPINPIFNYERLNFYFSYGYLPGNMSFFDNIYKLPPAHVLIFDLNTNCIDLKSYWSIPSYENSISEFEIFEKFSEIFKKSISRRMISDVPLGAFLSGGIDSSLVVAFMREAGVDRIKTFTVGFEGSSRNETGYAKIIANHFNTEHIEIIIKPEFENILEQIATELDEPIYDSSIIPTYCLCKYVREHVKVSLSGDGGDELFSGYVHYLSSLYCYKMSKFIPAPFKKIFPLIGRFLPEGCFGKNTLMSIGKGGYECYIYQTQIFKPHERKKLIPFLNNFNEPDLYKQKLMENYAGDFINKMAFSDFFINLQQILVKVDRASMMNSLEVRTPFLNKELIELSFKNISGKQKLKENKTKYLLKKIAKSKFPENFPIDRKQGFDIPQDFLAKTKLVEKLKSLDPVEFLNEEFIKKLIHLQKEGKRHYWNKLFAVYMFKMWYTKWIK